MKPPFYGPISGALRRGETALATGIANHLMSNPMYVQQWHAFIQDEMDDPAAQFMKAKIDVAA